jgi:hypothetical protein
MIPSLGMPTDHILTLLITERDKLNAAIDALQGPTKRRGRPPRSKNAPPDWVTSNGVAVTEPEKPARKKRMFTAAQRKKQALAMKKYWAAKKKVDK